MRKVPTNNQHLFYQPKDVWVGDVMPFGKDGTFYLYHQRDTRDPAPLAEGQPFGWSLATTQDFVTYQEHGTAIPHGGEDDQDQFIYAGTVYEAKGRYALSIPGSTATTCEKAKRPRCSCRRRPARMIMRRGKRRALQ